jgi:hypothetical protein
MAELCFVLWRDLGRDTCARVSGFEFGFRVQDFGLNLQDFGCR